MVLTECKMDLFKVSSDNFLVHCISSDFAMGAGIAVSFRNRGVKQYLQTHYHQKWNKYGYCLLSPIQGYKGVCNLVTKNYYYHKPTYTTITEALMDMKSQLPNDCKIAMPYIGCGLDKLEWEKVKNIILDVFNDTNVEISVCKL